MIVLNTTNIAKKIIECEMVSQHDLRPIISLSQTFLAHDTPNYKKSALELLKQIADKDVELIPEIATRPCIKMIMESLLAQEEEFSLALHCIA